MIDPPRSIAPWRLILPLTLQVAMVLGVAMPAWITTLTGKPVVLRTTPIDPYDLLRGYSQTLSYDISRIDTLDDLPGWPGSTADQNPTLYVLLEAPAVPDTLPPSPWKPIGIRATWTSDLPANQALLRGTLQRGQVIYGIETFYMPEDQKDEVNQAVNQANRRQLGAVEVKIDRQGKAHLQSLWVDQKNYRF